MAIRLDLKITGDRELLQAFRRGERAAGDLRPAWEVVEAQYREAAAEAFRTGRAGRVIWKRNAPGYARRPDKRGKGPLVLSGRYRRSFVREGAPGGIKEEGRRFIRLGSRNPLVNIHELGQPDPKTSGPSVRRPVLTILTPALRRQWADVVAEHLQLAIESPGQVRLSRRRRRRTA